MGYPPPADEIEILRHGRRRYDTAEHDAVVTSADVLKLQEIVPAVFVEDSILEFMLAIVAATRTETEFRAGISVRGALSLKLAAQAQALLSGRDFVMPEDVAAVVEDVFVHRLGLRRAFTDTLEERRVVGTILKRIVSSIPEPV
jgi:MoxR-like ATPase